MFESAAKCTSLTARAFWLIFAKTLAFGFGFVLPLMLVRRLGQTEFGLYKQAVLVVVTAHGLLPLSYRMRAYYFLPRERERRGAIVFYIMLYPLLTGSLALIVFLTR